MTERRSRVLLEDSCEVAPLWHDFAIYGLGIITGLMLAGLFSLWVGMCS